MSRLLQLYPAAWRERYEAEFLRVLQERPIGVRGSVDVVRGAVDARLHPELIGAVPQPWTHRLPGLFAMSAGLIWSWFFIRALLAGPDQEWGDSIGVAVVLMVIALPGDYVMAYGRRIGATILAIVFAMFLARALPWSVADGLLNLVAGATAWLLVGAGLLVLVALRAELGPRARWLVLGAAIVGPAIIGIPILGGFGLGDRGGPMAMLVAVMPYGAAWTLLGVRMIVRGSATIVDLPSNVPVPEVPAT